MSFLLSSSFSCKNNSSNQLTVHVKKSYIRKADFCICVIRARTLRSNAEMAMIHFDNDTVTCFHSAYDSDSDQDLSLASTIADGVVHQNQLVSQNQQSNIAVNIHIDRGKVAFFPPCEVRYFNVLFSFCQ